MSDERTRSVWLAVAGVVLTPVLYVASFGPAYATVLHKNCQNSGWFTVGYAPILWACNHSDLIGETLSDYSTWCFRSMYPILWK